MWIFIKNKYMYWHLIEKKKFLNSENIDDFLIGIVYGKRTQN